MVVIMFHIRDDNRAGQQSYCGDCQHNIRAASGFDFAHRRHRVHDLIRGSLEIKAEIPALATMNPSTILAGEKPT